MATLTTPIGRWGKILAGELVAAGMTGRLVVTHAEVLAPTKSPPSSDPQAGLLMLGAPDSISATKPPNTAPRFVSPPSPAPRSGRSCSLWAISHAYPIGRSAAIVQSARSLAARSIAVGLQRSSSPRRG